MKEKALFVGRFQPFHIGHLFVVKEMVKMGYHPLIVIGSAYKSHTFENPFTAGERFTMINRCLNSEKMEHTLIPVPDINRYALWVEHLESLLPRFTTLFTNSSILQELFKEKGYEIKVPGYYRREMCKASKIRALIAEGKSWKEFVPQEVYTYIKEIKGEERIRKAYREV
ncbi:MAG TPA: nicotinamide-nucleotide adenylyltransferase [Thermoplasmata archaeon]|nr:nicotinamide-nucleotide adenylyltransferase [Thermoplasmata archaeon]